jgi:hypothetical protein
MIEFPNKNRRARLRSITVTAINPTKYPQFCKDRENPFSTQSEEVRMGEIIDICATVLGQAGLDGRAPAEEVRSLADHDQSFPLHPWARPRARVPAPKACVREIPETRYTLPCLIIQ